MRACHDALLTVGLVILLAVGCHRDTKREPQEEHVAADHSAADAQTQPASTEVPAAIVGLDGSTKVQQEIIPEGTPKVCAKSPQTWIYSEPRQTSGKLGYLRLGACVAIDPQPVRNSSCSRGWQRLLSRGFVCLDGSSTIDANDPLVIAMRNLGPALDRKLPYIYGTVRRPGPVYRKIPTSEELRVAEPDLNKRFERWLNADGDYGARFAQQVWLPAAPTVPDPKQAWLTKLSDPIPEFLQSGRFAPRVVGDAASSISSVVLGAMATHVGYSILQTFLFEG